MRPFDLAFYFQDLVQLSDSCRIVHFGFFDDVLHSLHFRLNIPLQTSKLLLPFFHQLNEIRNRTITRVIDAMAEAQDDD